MTEKEQEILRLMYDLQIELVRNQGTQIVALKQAVESLERAHEIVAKLMKATSELIGVH